MTFGNLACKFGTEERDCLLIHYPGLPIIFHSNDFHTEITFSYYYFVLPHFIDLVWTPSYSKCIKYIHGYSTTLHLSKYAEWCKSERQATYFYKFRPCKFNVLWSQRRGLWPGTCHFQVLTSPCNNLWLLSLKKRALMSGWSKQPNLPSLIMTA